MTDETGSPVAEAMELPADAPESFDSVRDAAAYFTSLQEKRKEPAAESAPEATAEPESASQEADADPETAPSEEPDAAEPEATPPIEPPRSWTKAEKERFQSLPRETQEYLHTREQERDRDFRRSQNEIAEQRKAITAERDAAEKARQQYEAQLPALMQSLQDAQQASFADIKTMADVVKLQSEDPFRFQAWQVQQMQLQAANAESERVKSEQVQSKQSKRAAYEAEQNAALIEFVPEMADPKKANELRTRAVAMLTDDLGLKNDQLTRWMQDDTGHEILSNAGIQKLIADGLKYRDIQSASKAVAAKPLPPVQKPGTSKPVGSNVSERIQALEAKFNRTGDLKDASALYAAQIEAQTRRRAS